MLMVRKMNGAFFFTLVAIVLCAFLDMTGCASHGNETLVEVEANVFELADMEPYLGTWSCIGVSEDGVVRDLADYKAASGTSYSAKMVVRDNGFAYSRMERDGVVSSDIVPWLRQDYYIDESDEAYPHIPVGPLLFDGYFEMSEGRLLTPGPDGIRLIFGKESDSVEPLLRCVQLPGCSMDVPVELLEDFDSEDSSRGNSILRSTSVGLSGAWRNDGRTVTTALVYAKWIPESERDRTAVEVIETEENTFYLLHGSSSKDRLSCRVQFEAADELLPSHTANFEVSFYFDAREKQVYENYASHLFEYVHPNSVSDELNGYIEEGSGISSSERPGLINWYDAPLHIGEYVEVCGDVASTNYSPSSEGQPTFIDIGVAYPSANRVTAIIWGEDRSYFPGPPEDLYAGKQIKVKGELYLHDGICNIRVYSPNQIEAR